MDEGATEEEEEDDFDLIMRERPLEAHDDSDEESFKGSDDERKKRRAKTKSQNLDTFSIHGKPPVKVAPQTYVLDRGLDLPPGVERPNRWTGAPTGYKYNIAAEHGVYQSMNDIQSRDLAGHLYNAYAIRHRARRNSDADDDENEDQEAGSLRKRWTAWPMPAAWVPRVDEAIQRQKEGPDTWRMPPDPRPSADLEESIMATMMKTAKERFMAREWDLEEVRSSRAKTPSDPDGMKDEDDDKKDEEEPVTTAFHPVVQADDGASRHQLRPLSRNVISQLDQVLMGLHHSIRNRYNGDSTSEESSGNATEEEESRSRSRRKNGGASRPRGRKRVRQSPHTTEDPPGPRSSAPETEDETMPDVAHSRGPSHVSHDDRPSGNRRVALRDWSEVMGLAALVGLPSDAVMRASKRCADLFDEDMTFRTLGESRVKKVSRPNISRNWKYAYVESESGTETEPDREPKKRPRGRPKSTSKPPATQTQPQSQRSRSRSVAQPAPTTDPSIIVPSSSSATPMVSEPPADSSANPNAQPKGPQPGKGKGAHRKADLICPIKKCSRHTNGFSRVWNLNLHMKRVHPSYKADRERSRSQSVIEID